MRSNPKSTSTWSRLTAICLLAFVGAAAAEAQGRLKPLITTRIDETQRVQLSGNVPAQITGAADLGLVDAGEPSGRLLLVLKRSDEQENDLQDFLQTTHQQNSSNFHKWLAAGEFGNRFGASDSDVQQLTAWLQSHGLKVVGTSASRNTLEFSGSVGQVSEAFNTTIHKYSVLNAKTGTLETHYANATDPQVPAAFISAVAGVTQLNDFAPTPQVTRMGQAKYDAKKHTGVPQWSVPDGFGPTTPLYFFAPEDFATQYDVAPVYAAGFNGAGQTIGIVNDSNIDVSLVNAYRKLFNLPYNPPQVIVDGTDPGINGDALEAYLDVENAGAIAPAATVKLYVAGPFGFLGAGGLNFALLRAVNDDAASVLSVSFGQCEKYLGTANNAFLSGLWEEAAAQGQTVLVSSGDSGSFDHCSGLGVSGLASSPWNVAVGGTDAYYSDYATGGASIASFWSNTNDANLGSLQKKFAEQPWNGTVYGLNSTTYDSVAQQAQQSDAGGGGASSCSVSATDPKTHKLVCTSGWPKPSWQIGAGVPTDGARDLPDVSLFASNAYNGVIWPVCAEPGDCTAVNPASANSDLFVTGVGGTSASAPAMAGIMALINQKYGPQGQANFVLYPLATQFPTVFNDVTVGSNNVACSQYNVGSEFGCSADASGGGYSLQHYSAGPGYDQATGLGSIDVNQLFMNWAKVTFKTSGTTLSLSPTTFTHGTNVAASVAVSGTGTPAGSVALLADTTLVNNKSVTDIILTHAVGSTTLTNLPGGTYTVTGAYSGDGINGASVSTPVTLTVSPEPSTLQFTPQYFDSNTYQYTNIVSGSTVPYNSGVRLDVQIANAGGAGAQVATGTVTFTDGSTVLGTASVSAASTAEFNGSSLPVGPHTITVSYSGDASYSPSTLAPLQFKVSQASTFLSVFPDFTQVHQKNKSFGYSAGQNANLTALVAQNAADGGACPTGTLSFQFDTATPTVLPLAACENLLYYVGSTATLLLTNLQVGIHTLVITYAGDINYTGATIRQLITVTPATLLPSTTTLVTTPSNLSAATSGTPITATISVSGNGTVTPTGRVQLSLANFLAFTPAKLTPNGDGTAIAKIYFRVADLQPGPNQLIATYAPDSTYSGSVTTTTLAVNDGTDFSVQAADTTIAIAAGGTTSEGVTFTSRSGFNGPVTVSCSIPAGLTCTPASASVTLNGTASTTVSINTVTTVKAQNHQEGPAWLRTGAGTVLACMLFFVLPKRRPRLDRAIVGAFVMMVMLYSSGCGGKTNAGPTTVSTNAKPGTYTVIVSGTASSGIVHNVAVTLIVK